MSPRFKLYAAATTVLASGAALIVLAGCGSNLITAFGLPDGTVTLDQVAQGRVLVLSSGCGDCHSQGKTVPSDAAWLAGAAPGSGPGNFDFGALGQTHAPNLTPDPTNGALVHSTDRQVFNVLRWGLDPTDTRTDKVINSAADFPANPQYVGPPMPWPSFRHKSDSDLWAIVAYVKHGLKATIRVVPASTGPADHWLAFYATVGPFPAPAFPTSQEQFTP